MGYEFKMNRRTMTRELHTTINETHPRSEENSAQLQTSDVGAFTPLHDWLCCLHPCSAGHSKILQN
jgi:hypothetical protein